MKLFGRIDPKYFEITLVVLLLLSHLVLSLGNVHAILNWYLTDDAFYYFQVARNVSEGSGFTFDGINYTNGFHPLWMLVCVPVFALARFDLILPLRVLIMLMAVINAVGSVFLFRMLRRYVKIEIAAVIAMLWAFHRDFHAITTKEGLEAGISAMFIILLWERLTAFNQQEKIGPNGLRQMFWLGVLGTLTILSRLDNVYLVFFAGVWLWLRWWQPPDGHAADFKGKWWWRIKSGLAYNGVIILVMLAYLAWNEISFGTAMPVSGQFKIWWGSLPNSVYGYRVVDMQQLIAELFSRDIRTGPWAVGLYRIFNLALKIVEARQLNPIDYLYPVAWYVFGVVVLIFLLLAWFNRAYFFKTVIKLGLAPFFIGTLAQVAYYKRLGSLPQKAWYWVSERIFIILLYALTLHLIYLLLTRIKAKLPAQAMLAVLLLGTVYIPAERIEYIFGELRNGRQQEVHDYLHRAAFLEETFAPGTIIAITGSGSWNYFSENHIIFNMDGLINSYEYLEAMKAGEGAAFLAQSGVQYVLGNPFIIENTNPYGPMLEGHLELYTKYYPPYTSRKFVWKFIP